MQTHAPNIEKVHGCRACGSSELKKFLHLPSMPFTDDFVDRERFGSEFRADIDVYYCARCFTAQTQHDVDMGEYYKDYQYSVGGSISASRFMHLLAANLKSRYFSGQDSFKVLEVGSGDGAQLEAFAGLGCEVMGYEPSESLCRVAAARGIQSVEGLFGPGSIGRLPPGFQKVDVVALAYTFDHLPAPSDFLRAARQVLNDDGLLVVEVHDLEKIVERNEYCLFEHEHTIYLNRATAQALCETHGFEIINFDIVPERDRRANSLLFVATPKGSRHARAKPAGTPASWRSPEYFGGIEARIFESVGRLESFVDRMTRDGKRLAGYGAGGRGVMTLAAMRNAGKFEYLLDKKPKKAGVLAPKSGVEIAEIELLRDRPVDHVLVFSFGYMNEIADDLARFGYRREQLHSLLDVLGGSS